MELPLHIDCRLALVRNSLRVIDFARGYLDFPIAVSSDKLVKLQSNVAKINCFDADLKSYAWNVPLAVYHGIVNIDQRREITTTQIISFFCRTIS